MSAPAIKDLPPPQALKRAIQASEKLLAMMSQLEEQEVEGVEKLAQIRTQLVEQVFVTSWTEEAVATHLADLQRLEALSEELQSKASEVRSSLHEQRASNQHKRKAVNAYGQAKGQFSR